MVKKTISTVKKESRRLTRMGNIMVDKRGRWNNKSRDAIQKNRAGKKLNRNKEIVRN